MNVGIHLQFSGQCREAFEFYRDLLGGTEFTMTTFRETPAGADAPDDFADKIVHATLTLPFGTLAGADLPGDRFRPPAGFALLLSVEEPEEAERLFARLAEGGKVEMPLQQTFWSLRFGVVTDRFGTPWEVNTTQLPH